MRKEDLKDWTRDRLKDEVVRLHNKLDLFGIKFEENPNNFSFSYHGDRYWAGTIVNDIVVLKEENKSLKSRIEKIESGICGEGIIFSKYDTFEGESWIRAEQYDEVLLRLQKANERTNKLEAENKAIKQQIQNVKNILEAVYKPESAESVMQKTGCFTEKAIKEVCNYEPQLAPDDDISSFNHECMKQWVEELAYKKKNMELQDQHQQDCIRINDLRTAYLIMVDELAKLREQFGMER